MNKDKVFVLYYLFEWTGSVSKMSYGEKILMATVQAKTIDEAIKKFGCESEYKETKFHSEKYLPTSHPKQYRVTIPNAPKWWSDKRSWRNKRWQEKHRHKVWLIEEVPQ